MGFVFFYVSFLKKLLGCAKRRGDVFKVHSAYWGFITLLFFFNIFGWVLTQACKSPQIIAIGKNHRFGTLTGTGQGPNFRTFQKKTGSFPRTNSVM